MGTSRRRDLSSQILEGCLGINLLKKQKGKEVQQEKQHLQGHTGVPSGESGALGTAGEGGYVCLNKAGCEGGQGPRLYVLLRYPACPEGNGEPAKG